jgi:hypothetical protein
MHASSIMVGRGDVKLSDLITPTTSAGTALFLIWNGYHVFSIPKRDVLQALQSVRFFGVGGKRINCHESLVDCALREGTEEIGAVVSSIDSAEHTYFLRANGSLEMVQLIESPIRPRLILEKRNHSDYGSMANLTAPYYLVAFNASLSGKPKPCNEIAATLYLKDTHLSLMKRQVNTTIATLMELGAHIEYQADSYLNTSMVLIPHGTARFLIRQLPD